MRARYADWVPRLLGCADAALVEVDRARTPQAALARVVAATGETLRVTDSSSETDQRVVSALAGLGARACLGVPLPAGEDDGSATAVLLAWDAVPRVWSAAELADLEELARVAAVDPTAPSVAPAAAEAEARRGRTLLSLSESLSATRTLPDIAHAVELVALIQLGCHRADLWLDDEDGGRRLVVPRGREGAADPATSSSKIGDAGARLRLPLAVGEQRVGVLDLRWDAAPPEADDLPTLEALAAYTAQAVQRAVLLQERLGALVTLQQSLLPRLRPLPDVEVAARYLPAGSRDRVGGDWYDAVALPTGGCAVTVGDVVGHDVHAAAAMGQVRTVLRALAWSGSGGPAATLGRLDRALDELGLDTLATAVVAHLEPHGEGAGAPWSLAWSSAGHPPPLLLAEGRSRLLEPGAPDGVDLMLGVAPSTDRVDRRLEVPSGAVLLLYSDGLIERASEHLDDGLTRLCRAAEEAAAAASSLEALLDGVLERMTGAGRADDVAVLAVRRTS